MSPLGNFSSWLDGILNKYLGNLIKSYTHSGMTDEDKEKTDYGVEASVDLFNRTQSLPAQMAQAQEAGINPFVVFGNGGSPGGTTAVSPGSGSGSDLLSALLNYKLGQRKLDIEEELLPYRQDQLAGSAELSYAKSFEISQLLPYRAENLQASTDKFLEQINTERTQQALNEAGISVREADAAVKLREAAILAIDESKRPAFLDSEIALNRATEAMQRATAARDYKEIARITQEIENMKVERDNLLKEGVGILIENGKMAHEMSILAKEDANTDKRIKQENAGRVVDMVTKSVDTVVGVVAAGTGVATAGASVSRASSYARDVSARIDRYNRPRRSR